MNYIEILNKIAAFPGSPKDTLKAIMEGDEVAIEKLLLADPTYALVIREMGQKAAFANAVQKDGIRVMDAVVRIGINKVRGILAAILLQRIRNSMKAGSIPKPIWNEFWDNMLKTMLTRAFFTEGLLRSNRVTREFASDTFVSLLFIEIGLFVLAYEKPLHVIRLKSMKKNGGYKIEDTAEVIQKYLDFDYEKLIRDIFEFFELPDELVDLAGHPAWIKQSIAERPMHIQIANRIWRWEYDGYREDSAELEKFNIDKANVIKLYQNAETAATNVVGSLK